MTLFFFTLQAIDPHWFYISVVEEINGTRYQGGSFSFLMWGGGFRSLRIFTFFFFLFLFHTLYVTW